jgi:methylated-DNA-[protein]-cysteine S-methyltransferase
VTYAAVLATPLPGAARLGLVVEDGALVALDLLPPATAPRVPSAGLAAEAARQVAAYFADPRRGFDLPVAARGTPFQRRVWARIARIPAGGSATYGELAAEVGGGARAVGGACRANPVPIVVPCHRVLAAGGRGGYMGRTSGDALAIKEWLLAHEGVVLR